jgi:hypothetical protein
VLLDPEHFSEEERSMRTPFASLALLTMLLAAPAYAFHCPGDMADIDVTLKEKAQTLSADVLAEVKKLRAEGEALHKAGKHGESVATLAKAKALLGIE